MFVGLHVLLAERTMTPELAITPEEGQQFMGAVQNVMRHYSVQTTQKTLDWIALMGMTTGMYAPRIVAMNIRKRAQRAGRPMPQPAAAQAAPRPNAPTQPGPIPQANGASPEHVTIMPDMFSQSGFQDTE